MVTNDDQDEVPLDDDALTTAEQVRARVAARTRLELQRCKEAESPLQPIAPVPIPEATVEVERSPDDSESRMQAPPRGNDSESDNTTADTDILAAAMSAAEIVTETGPRDNAAKQLAPPPQVPPVPPTTSAVQTVEPVPSTEALLGLIFQGSVEEATWASQRLPEIIQHKLSGLGIESSRTEPSNPVASDATGIRSAAVQDEQTMADNKEPDAEDETHSAIISSIPTANSFDSLEDDVGDVAPQQTSTSRARPAEQCGGLPRDSLSPRPPPPAPTRENTLRLSPRRPRRKTATAAQGRRDSPQKRPRRERKCQDSSLTRQRKQTRLPARRGPDSRAKRLFSLHRRAADSPCATKGTSPKRCSSGVGTTGQRQGLTRGGMWRRSTSLTPTPCTLFSPPQTSRASQSRPGRLPPGARRSG
ncbi:unnamed protein product [Ixodes hexagonus]